MNLDTAWLTDARIRQIKEGDDATPAETLALAGEVRERRRRMLYNMPQPHPSDDNITFTYDANGRQLTGPRPGPKPTENDNK